MWITFKVQPYNSNFGLSSKIILTKNPNLKNFFSFFFSFGGGGGGMGIPTGKKTIGNHLFFVLMLYIKFQVPSSSGSLTQKQGVTDR